MGRASEHNITNSKSNDRCEISNETGSDNHSVEPGPSCRRNFYGSLLRWRIQGCDFVWIHH